MFDIALIFQSAIVFLFSLIPVMLVGRAMRLEDHYTLLLYVWHTAMCVAVIYLVSLIGGDETTYYEAGVTGITWNGLIVEPGIGTMFVNYITMLMVQYLLFSFISTFLVFNAFGTIGLIIMVGNYRELGRNTRFPMLPWIWVAMLLPGLSFWTCSIGKDGIALIATSLFVLGSMCGRRRTSVLILSVVLMFLVRPHMALPMIISWSILYAIQKRIGFGSMVMTGLIVMVGLYFIAPFIAAKLGLPDLSLESIQSYSELRELDIDRRDDAAFWLTKPVPLRIWMTMFFPSVLSAQGPFEMAVALENLVLLAFAAILVWKSRFMTRIFREDIHLWVYLFAAWVELGAFMYNSGLAARQKWMFAPILIFLSLKYIGAVHNRNLR